MKPIKNFTDHNALEDDTYRYIFNIGSGLYLLSEQEVREILPCEIEFTNIGDPYHDLVRFVYRPIVEDEEEYIDISPYYLPELLEILEFVSDCDYRNQIPERLQKYLNNE